MAHRFGLTFNQCFALRDSARAKEVNPRDLYKIVLQKPLHKKLERFVEIELEGFDNSDGEISTDEDDFDVDRIAENDLEEDTDSETDLETDDDEESDGDSNDNNNRVVFVAQENNPQYDMVVVNVSAQSALLNVDSTPKPIDNKNTETEVISIGKVNSTPQVTEHNESGSTHTENPRNFLNLEQGSSGTSNNFQIPNFVGGSPRDSVSARKREISLKDHQESSDSDDDEPLAKTLKKEFSEKDIIDSETKQTVSANGSNDIYDDNPASMNNYGNARSTPNEHTFDQPEGGQGSHSRNVLTTVSGSSGVSTANLESVDSSAEAARKERFVKMREAFLKRQREMDSSDSDEDGPSTKISKNAVGLDDPSASNDSQKVAQKDKTPQGASSSSFGSDDHLENGITITEQELSENTIAEQGLSEMTDEPTSSTQVGHQGYEGTDSGEKSKNDE